MIFIKQALKKYLLIGAISSIPIMFAMFLARTATNFVGLWEQLFKLFSIGDYYHPAFAFLLTLVMLIAWGKVLTSKFFDKVFSIIPFVGRIWSIFRSMANRILFVASGGYERVVYEQFGPGSERWKPGFVVGRTVFKDPVKGDKKMLVILTANFSLPDSVWIPPENTRIVTGGLQSIGLFITSGGFVNPAEMQLEEWTDEKVDEIPEIDPKDT